MNIHFDTIIIGGGAAGLFCAATAGKRSKRVLVLESSERVGKKILISGGGRCNFTNLGTSPANFLSANPNFCRSALSRYTPQDFLALVQKHGIAVKEKAAGQLFCAKSAKDIVQLLLSECRDAGVTLQTSALVSEIAFSGKVFHVTTAATTYTTTALVIATGGLSYTRLGASDFGYRVAKQFKISVLMTKPALVPLLFDAADQKRFGALAGIATPVIIRCGKTMFQDDLLFTHRGLSGPAALQISSSWQKGVGVTVDFLPGKDLQSEWLALKEKKDRRLPKNILAGLLPDRLAEALCLNAIPERPLMEISDRDLKSWVQKIHAWPILPTGTEGYHNAEVTLGGVDTKALSSKTMECESVKGLYFIGEVLDVTGHLGGYNFQWAWASGFAAGNAV
jgi:predicted Rossmann fold flavoprotein